MARAIERSGIYQSNAPQREGAYPIVVHLPTGKTFGGEQDTKVVLHGQNVEVRYNHNLTLSFPAEESILIPGTDRAYRFEPIQKPQKSFVKRIVNKLTHS